MADDFDLRDFGKTVRLFPLRGVVLFPHAVMPLHIFEPRYRQMTAHALAGDRLVTIVQPREPIDPGVPEAPALEEIACVGRIVQHEPLPDGRYNFLLLGLERVRLVRELAVPTLYRQAEVEILESIPTDDPADPRTAELGRLFLDLADRQGSLAPELRQLVGSGLPPGVLTDLVAHALALPPPVKQSLLAERRVDRRLDELIARLGSIEPRPTGGPAPGHRYPPPIHLN